MVVNPLDPRESDSLPASVSPSTATRLFSRPPLAARFSVVQDGSRMESIAFLAVETGHRLNVSGSIYCRHYRGTPHEPERGRRPRPGRQPHRGLAKDERLVKGVPGIGLGSTSRRKTLEYGGTAPLSL
jgi:hypothetical protein